MLADVKELQKHKCVGWKGVLEVVQPRFPPIAGLLPTPQQVTLAEP